MKKNFAILPYNSTQVKDKTLVTTFLGSWDLLDKDEFMDLHAFRIKKDSPLFKRLHKKGLIIDEHNLDDRLEKYRNLNSHLFADTSLHIAVITTRCNLNCAYCQTKTSKPKDMDPNVANRVLTYLFGVRNPNVVLEFQGGEPLLNWDVLAFLIEHARKFNTTGKNLKLALVSNLLLLDDKKIKFLIKHDVEICASLDGPKFIHDKNRVYDNGAGSYEQVVSILKRLKNKYHKSINLLPTITKYSLRYPEEIVDEYLKFGQMEIALRPVNQMGTACSNWEQLGYTPEEFIGFYSKAMDYILTLNNKGILIRERMARMISEKILRGRNPGYVELMNPCGAGRTTIAYMPDGTCFPCDEARMTGDEMFKIGDILSMDYEQCMKSENLLHLSHASSVNLWAYNSPFAPWLGFCPIVNYATEKNLVPKISCSAAHKIYTYQFQYIFEKIAESQNYLKIFKDWTGGDDEKKSENKNKKIQ